MKNTLVIMIVLLVLGGGAYAVLRRDAAPMTEPVATGSMDSLAVNEVATPATGNIQPAAAGQYLPFSPEVLSGSADTRRVLFFYANWCPTCRPVDTIFSEQTARIPADVTLIRVNYNDTETDQAEEDLAKKYGVTYQHTFVQIDAQDNLVTIWNGGQIEELLSNIR